jgi:hypothetical protein
MGDWEYDFILWHSALFDNLFFFDSDGTFYGTFFLSVRILVQHLSTFVNMAMAFVPESMANP